MREKHRARAGRRPALKVAVAARSARMRSRETAEEIGGLAIECDVSDRSSQSSGGRKQVEEAYGRLDLLVSNAGMSISENDAAWEVEPADWWRVFEVNVLGVYLCCRSVIPGMLARGGGRIVNVASGAAYLPGPSTTSYCASKAAVHRFSETLALQLEPAWHPCFLDQPGPRSHEDDRRASATTCPGHRRSSRQGSYAPWRQESSIALAGRYLHAEHDDVDDIASRADEIVSEGDLNAIRLRR